MELMILLQSSSWEAPLFNASDWLLLEARLFKKEAWNPVVPDVSSGGLFITVELLDIASTEPDLSFG